MSDAHERACDLGFALPIGANRRERVARIHEAGLLFVHVPKTAGMSVSAALYGEQIKHASIRLLHRLDPTLRTLPSFAILRDPAERFLSAFRYARAGGSVHNDIAEPFRPLYRAFRSIDDALDHVAAATSPYAIDHVFRPQRWYLTDHAGRIAVDRLVPIDDIDRLSLLVAGFPRRELPALNRSAPAAMELSRIQQTRLRHLYADDYALWDGIVVGRSATAMPDRRPDARVGPLLVV